MYDIISDIEQALENDLGTTEAAPVAEAIDEQAMVDDDFIERLMNQQEDTFDEYEPSKDEQRLLKDIESLDDDEQELFEVILDGLESGDISDEEVSEIVGFLDEMDEEGKDRSDDYDRGQGDEGSDDGDLPDFDEEEDEED